MEVASVFLDHKLTLMELLGEVQVYLLVEVSLGELGGNTLGVSLHFLEFRMLFLLSS